MTCCIGIRVKEGLVGIADTRVTSGSECITARKVSHYEIDGGAFFIMTSGLRSVRDKVLIYFQEAIDQDRAGLDRLYKVVNLLAEQIRRVAKEDKEALGESGVHFNIHVLLGGQLHGDNDHHLFMIYPEANWVEVGPGTPYSIIGASGYGKPVLDRTLDFNDTMRFALKVGFLAFDSTRISAADVDFPIDVVLYQRDTGHIVEYRYNKDDFRAVSEWWQERLRGAISNLPADWTETILSKLDQTAGPPMLKMEDGAG